MGKRQGRGETEREAGEREGEAGRGLGHTGKEGTETRLGRARDAEECRRLLLLWSSTYSHIHMYLYPTDVFIHTSLYLITNILNLVSKL